MDLSSDNTAEGTCRVLLTISLEQTSRDGFLLELVSHVNDWPGVDLLGIEFVPEPDEADAGPLNTFS
ncbi:hypothetical protein [Pseudomonas vanderleydeniana]|uniref:Uncharacterized protein n=1 Tax=Pseudomonas vanderleydeniana TaxID=2745495 RepID=A0A9E6PGI4_9PSED|nr:hypothetical protein [Pseudomonas vanderleydeniana]QXI26254.1 hypothetical protein HU752_020105 [Pseudomonas vanderleydeniana]